MTDDTTLAAKLGTGFEGTSMSILGGSNVNGAKTNYGKLFSSEVTTSWSPAEAGLSSDVLSLGGIAKMPGSACTDNFVLSMTFNPGKMGVSDYKKGHFGLLTRSAGEWVFAGLQTSALHPNFVLGPWQSGYDLGTYGVDPATNTAWAVVNYNGDFAVGVAAP